MTDEVSAFDIPSAQTRNIKTYKHSSVWLQVGQSSSIYN